MSPKHLKTSVVILAKLLITVGLMWLVVSKVDLGATAEQITLINPFWVLASLLIHTLNFACGTARVGYLLAMFGEKVPFLRMFRISLIGAFFSQALITFLSGDAMRIWSLTREGLPLLKGASAILLDRAVGIIAIALLLFATMPRMLDIVTDDVMRYSLLTLAGMCLFAIALFMILGLIMPSRLQSRPVLGVLSDLASVSRHVWRMPGMFWRALIFSVVIHLGNTLAIYLLSLGFGLEISFFQCLIVVPTVILLSMLPISVAGWGIREGAMVIAFGLLGFAPEPTIAVSILFGLSLLIASLPGGVLWFWAQKPTRHASSKEASS